PGQEQFEIPLESLQLSRVMRTSGEGLYGGSQNGRGVPRGLWRPRPHLLPDTEGREDPVQNRIVGVDAQHALEFQEGVAQIHQDSLDRHTALEPIRGTVQRCLSGSKSLQDSKAGDDTSLVTVDGRSRVDP